MRVSAGISILAVLLLSACGKPSQNSAQVESTEPPVTETQIFSPAAVNTHEFIPQETPPAPPPINASENKPAPVAPTAPPPVDDSQPELTEQDFAQAGMPPEDTPIQTPPPPAAEPKPEAIVPQPVPLPKPRPHAAPAEKSPAPAKAVEKLSNLESELLNLLNAARAKKGLHPLKFNRTQSKGTGSCVGSRGHSEHMASTRTMSHDQFPQDICVRAGMSAENVGYASGGEIRAIRAVHKMMMDEGPGGGHYDNIMNPSYNAVGLGFFYFKGTLWITENFLRL